MGGRDPIAVQHRAVADEHSLFTNETAPALEHRRRVVDARRIERDEPCWIERRRRRNAIQRCKHVTAVRVHPRGHSRAGAEIAARCVCQRIERRDADDVAARDEGQPLNRRDADSQPGERSGPRGHGKQIDRRQRHVMCARDVEELLRQPLGMRPRVITTPFVHDAFVVDERHAAGARRRVESQYEHAGSQLV